MTDQKDDLKERVEKFLMLGLPGQPMMMHMGTSYLVQDLWREVRQLRDQLASQPSGMRQDENR